MILLREKTKPILFSETTNIVKKLHFLKCCFIQQFKIGSTNARMLRGIDSLSIMCYLLRSLRYLTFFNFSECWVLWFLEVIFPLGCVYNIIPMNCAST